jgi:hypothetical protein
LNPDVTRVNFSSLDFYPVFIDYDMENRKCRGMSAKLDLFSYGLLTEEIERFSADDLRFAIQEGLFIRKYGLLFEKGFFLFDFSYITENIKEFSEKIRQMGVDLVYIENSNRFDISNLINALPCKGKLLEFDDASHG